MKVDPAPPVALLAEQRHGYPKASPLTAANIAVHLVGATLLSTMLVLALAWLGPALISMGPMRAIVAIMIGTFAGLFAADLLSGAAHWAFDTWFDEDHPLFHRMVLVVREHHIAPQEMFRYPFYNDTGQLSVLALLLSAPIAAPILLWAGPSIAAASAIWACAIASLCFVFMLEFHKCGHRKPARGVFGLLQRSHLLLSPDHHWRHHRDSYDTHYCLINGWADAVMDRIGGWRALERVIHRVTQAVPRASDDRWLEAWLTPRRKELWHEARGWPNHSRGGDPSKRRRA